MNVIQRFLARLPGASGAMLDGSASAPPLRRGMTSGGAGTAGTPGTSSATRRENGNAFSTGLNRIRPTRSTMLEYDHTLMWVVIALLGLGLVMVYSASIAMPDSPKYASYTTNHFLLRHIVSLVVGLGAAIFVFRIPINTWDKWAPKLFVASLVLLVIVLIPHIGKGVNGARRWIPLGITNMQPSEIMKLAVTIYAANYTVRKQEFMHSFSKGFLPMAFAVGTVGAMLLLEPDMGAFMVIAAIAMGLLFLGGVNAKLFGGRNFTGKRTRRYLDHSRNLANQGLAGKLSSYKLS